MYLTYGRLIMRKLNTILFTLILIFNSESSILSSFASDSKTKIGFLLADLKVERWKSDRDFFLMSAGDNGYDVLVADAENSQEKQIEEANNMIKAGAKLLVVVAVDAYQAARIVENAHKAGVKVIAYDRLIMNCDLDAYIAYDNEDVGTIMAIYITLRKRKGHFVYIGGPKSDRNTYYIRNGIMQTLKPDIDTKSIIMECDTFTNNWDEQEAYDIMKKYFDSGKPAPDAVFAGNDQLARGVIKVLELKGLAGDVLVTGQDGEISACRYIVAGKQALTIFKPIKTLADRAVMLTSLLLGEMTFDFDDRMNNGKKEVLYFKLLPVPVDRSNMRISIIYDQFHTEDEVYK
jgi:D-xylose transport system substrate-binding protein